MGFFTKGYRPPEFGLEKGFIAMPESEFGVKATKQFEQWIALHQKVREGSASAAEKEAEKNAEEWKQAIDFARSFRCFLVEAGWSPPQGE